MVDRLVETARAAGRLLGSPRTRRATGDLRALVIAGACVQASMQVGAIAQSISDFKVEMKAQVTGLRNEVKEEVSQLRHELKMNVAQITDALDGVAADNWRQDRDINFLKTHMTRKGTR